MKHLTLFGSALAAVFALGIATATSALALPDISVTLTGGTYPIQLVGSSLTDIVKFNNVIGEKFEGEGWSRLLLLTALGHLGTFKAAYTKVKKNGVNCNTEGDTSEVVLGTGTWHLVYTSLAGSTQGLQLGVLYLWLPFLVKCGTETISFRGNTIASVKEIPTGESVDLSSLTLNERGNGKGSPDTKFYYNEGGTSVKADLEENFGTGFKEGDEEVENTGSVFAAAEGKMFLVTSR
jgi:hypothetical protein